MQTWVRCGGLLLLLATSAVEAAPPLAGEPKRPFIGSSVETPPTPNVLLVALRDDEALHLETTGRMRARAASLERVLMRHGLARYEPIGSTSARRGPRYLRLRSDRPDFDVRAAARELAGTEAFRAVSPDVVVQLFVVPNDPYVDPFYQWHVESPYGGNLPAAWDLGQGNASTVIAVMDNGFDITHPDLSSKLWVNAGEIAGNSFDDDANGYVDDVNGWDFGADDNDPSAHEMLDASGIDVGFHGSFVAGIAVAATNNGTGIAGSGWSCRFMPLKVGNAAGQVTLEAVTEAFEYVVDQGAAVLNMSFGSTDTLAAPFFQALVDDATAAGIVCVAAAGNNGLERKAFPAACQNVLSVGATDQNDLRASFSNWGSWVDVAAPGATMWSSICQNYTLDEFQQILYMLFFGWDGVDPYMYGDGTSFASPLVAGVCGLLRARSPALTPEEVIGHIQRTGDLVAYDHPIGRRLNAFRALSEPVVAVEPISSLEASVGAWPNPFEATTTIGFTLSQAGPIQLRVYDLNGRVVRSLIAATLPAGRHAALWDGRGQDGRALGSGVYFAVLEQAGARGSRRIVLAR